MVTATRNQNIALVLFSYTDMATNNGDKRSELERERKRIWRVTRFIAELATLITVFNPPL